MVDNSQLISMFPFVIYDISVIYLKTQHVHVTSVDSPESHVCCHLITNVITILYSVGGMFTATANISWKVNIAFSRG